ncbi:MAG: nucleotidyltransferase family protein [Actinobacteria bacterium]|nr:nucleotidyltransferase family protein [Actinomycetota bacterium]
MELRPGIEVNDDVLDSFARRHSIRRLAVFGSVLRSDFGPASDIDLLVEFDPDHVPGLLAVAAMELELEQIFGRAVDLRTYGDLSRYFRDGIRASARDLYAA